MLKLTKLEREYQKAYKMHLRQKHKNKMFWKKTLKFSNN